MKGKIFAWLDSSGAATVEKHEALLISEDHVVKAVMEMTTTPAQTGSLVPTGQNGTTRTFHSVKMFCPIALDR